MSVLPFPVLYLLSDFLYLALFYALGYRKDIVLNNLTNAFPEKSKSEILALRKGYYKWFCDMLLETMKNLTISKKEMLKRCTLSAATKRIFDDYYKQNKHVIIVMGHYGNWEWAGNSFSLLQQHQLFVIYHPLKNTRFNNLITSMRTRFGTKLIPMRETGKEMLNNRTKNPSATAFIADQTPQPDYAHWMSFMNQDTPVFLGPSKFAKKLNYPVVYIAVNRIKRGYYQIESEILFDQPENEDATLITVRHTQRLQQDIMLQPSTWLWSHRRWKHKRTTESIQKD